MESYQSHLVEKLSKVMAANQLYMVESNRFKCEIDVLRAQQNKKKTSRWDEDLKSKISKAEQLAKAFQQKHQQEKQ